MIEKYTPVWHKYRPVLLKLMLDAAQGPQEYALSKHEFLDIDPRQKGGYSFTLRSFKGKVINDIKTSIVAQHLLLILQQSGKAQELTSTAIYEFTLDKQFILHVKQEEIPVEESDEEI
ncbi:hypothetical protein FNH22_28760 [Fulvivirga sp. M361]|uniref:hypothetical protein n=1 Tax=Fulvivirga sp. M361 TaxID=2594266 RepID=UPI00117B0A43|nr:hypothetical protein [Fulvivirga sp. M361]TRX48588.1 hypothetical protein FNH22_28760 [Fulvivirga sp. M361]